MTKGYETSSAERWLKLLLRLCGILDVMGIIGVVMPQSWLAWCIARVEPELSVGLLVSYLARLVSGLYVLVGVMLLVFATDVRHYRLPITLAMWWIVLFCAAVLIPGAKYIPRLVDQWFFWCIAFDGALVLATVAAVLYLQSRIGDQEQDLTAS
jgi:hypothetical protein